MSKHVSEKIQDIPTSTIRLIFEKARGMKKVVRLELGEPDFDTPAHIREAAKKALDEGFTHYTSFAGFEDLRQAISEKAKAENGIESDSKKEIIVTPGASSALYCGLFSIINAGEKVLIPDPGWPHYEVCVHMAGGIVEYYPLLEEHDFRIDPDDLKKRIDKNTKAIVINSPNNPTGCVLTRKQLEEIAQIAIENDLIVVSDEVYERIIYDDAKHVSIASLMDMKDRTLTINSLSKTYAMTGWRIGYAIGSEELATQMAKLVLYTGTCTNSISQKAALAALKGPQDCVEDMVKKYKHRRDFLVKRLNELEAISCRMPQGAFYAFANIKRLGMPSLDCALYLLEHAKVSTVPGVGFGKHGEGYLRLSYTTTIENLKEALKRIETATKSI